MDRDSDYLSWEDTRILRLESAAIKGHVTKVLILGPDASDRPLELEALRRHVAGRLERSPRARQRIAFPPLRAGPPVWVDDQQFDIAAHVRRRDAGGRIDAIRLRELVAEVMAERLDHSRPLWCVDLIGPLADGGSALVFRIHHCMADGITCLRFGEEILWDHDPETQSPEPAPWRPDPAPSGLDLAADAIGHRLRSAGRGIRGLAGGALKPSSWRSAARSVAELPGALARELAPGAADQELRRRIGSRRAVAFVERPLDELRAIAHSASDRLGAHVTINDVALGTISGALHFWLGERGDEHLRAQVPVSMHRRDEQEDELGNRDSFLFIDLPLSEPDPIRRLESINAESSERKIRHDAEELYAFFHALGRLGPLGRAGAGLASGPREFSLSISNVPGPREPIYVLGTAVRSLHSLAEPADRHALRVSAISCGGRFSFALCSDPDAVGDLDRLEGAVVKALDELGAQTGATAEPSS